MGFEITAYHAIRMKAEAQHSNTSSWVDVTVIERNYRGPPSKSTLTIHFDGDDSKSKADAYAASINFVDLRFHTAEVMKEKADA